MAVSFWDKLASRFTNGIKSPQQISNARQKRKRNKDTSAGDRAFDTISIIPASVFLFFIFLVAFT